MLGGYGHVRLERVYEIVYTLEYIYIYISMMMLTVYLNIKVIWPYMSSLNCQMHKWSNIYIFFLPSNTKYMQDI